MENKPFIDPFSLSFKLEAIVYDKDLSGRDKMHKIVSLSRSFSMDSHSLERCGHAFKHVRRLAELEEQEFIQLGE